jgi:hypothetical protein
MTIKWSLATVVGDNRIDDYKENREITGCFYDHGDVEVRCRAHRPMEHTPGFTRSHWMPPSGKCLHCIAPAAAMVSEF